MNWPCLACRCAAGSCPLEAARGGRRPFRAPAVAARAPPGARRALRGKKCCRRACRIARTAVPRAVFDLSCRARGEGSARACRPWWWAGRPKGDGHEGGGLKSRLPAWRVTLFPFPSAPRLVRMRPARRPKETSAALQSIAARRRRCVGHAWCRLKMADRRLLPVNTRALRCSDQEARIPPSQVRFSRTMGRCALCMPARSAVPDRRQMILNPSGVGWSGPTSRPAAGIKPVPFAATPSPPQRWPAADLFLWCSPGRIKYGREENMSLSAAALFYLLHVWEAQYSPIVLCNVFYKRSIGWGHDSATISGSYMVVLISSARHFGFIFLNCRYMTPLPYLACGYFTRIADSLLFRDSVCYFAVLQRYFAFRVQELSFSQFLNQFCRRQF